MRRRAAWLLVPAIVLAPAAWAANRSTLLWETPRPVDRDTVFFGEMPAEKEGPEEPPKEEVKPLSGKVFAWENLEKGNAHFLNHEYEEAALYFKAAYAVAGPTRVLSGFRLVDAYDRLDWADSALGVLEEMEKKYLVSPREFRESKRLRQALEDKRRRGLVHKKVEPFTGREWVKQISEWRLRWVLGAMDEMRRHGVPLREQPHAYVFHLEEYFLARPQLPAEDAPAAFAEFLYQHDRDTRSAIDHWRMNPEGTLTEEAKVEDLEGQKLTGAQWVTLTQNDKLEYVKDAMKILKGQRVPMEKDVYAYADALDRLFTEKPALPASDSVAALASLLHESEPGAAEILDALRLK